MPAGIHTASVLAGMDAFLSRASAVGGVPPDALATRLLRFAEDLVSAAEADGQELDADQFDELIEHIATVQNRAEQAARCVC